MRSCVWINCVQIEGFHLPAKTSQCGILASFGHVLGTDPFKIKQLLEQRQYKKDSSQTKIILVLKLPRFFSHHVGDEKARQFQNWIFFTDWGRSYIVLALGDLGCYS